MNIFDYANAMRERGLEGKELQAALYNRAQNAGLLSTDVDAQMGWPEGTTDRWTASNERSPLKGYYPNRAPAPVPQTDQSQFVGGITSQAPSPTPMPLPSAGGPIGGSAPVGAGMMGGTPPVEPQLSGLNAMLARQQFMQGGGLPGGVAPTGIGEGQLNSIWGPIGEGFSPYERQMRKNMGILPWQTHGNNPSPIDYTSLWSMQNPAWGNRAADRTPAAMMGGPSPLQRFKPLLDENWNNYRAGILGSSGPNVGQPDKGGYAPIGIGQLPVADTTTGGGITDTASILQQLEDLKSRLSIYDNNGGGGG